MKDSYSTVQGEGVSGTDKLPGESELEHCRRMKALLLKYAMEVDWLWLLGYADWALEEQMILQEEQGTISMKAK